MGRLQTDRVGAAMEQVDDGISPYRAAKTAGIALSTIYRALDRRAGRKPKPRPKAPPTLAELGNNIPVVPISGTPVTFD